MSDAPPPSRRGRLARWAAIVLPIVVGLRALLLVFQLSGEHHPHPPQPLAWPPVPGERLAFERDSAGIRAWSVQPDHAAIPAALIEKNDQTMPDDTGCMLNPEAMTGFVGGTLTLVSVDPDGSWIATWSGAATMPSLAGSGAGQGDTPAQRQLEAAMLDAADCGMTARLRLTLPALHRLITILNDQPPPPPGTDPVPAARQLNIRVQPPAAP